MPLLKFQPSYIQTWSPMFPTECHKRSNNLSWMPNIDSGVTRGWDTVCVLWPPKGPVVLLEVGWTMDIRWRGNWQGEAGVSWENIVPLLVSNVSLWGNGAAGSPDVSARVYQNTRQSFSYSPHTETQILITA